jgi:hypothetical protein
MSYDVIVYMHSSRFPELNRLAEEVSARSPRLALPPSFDLRVASGYVPLGSTGFEVMSSPITSKDEEDYREICREDGEAVDADDEYLTVLRESDTCITFCCQDDEEILAARLIGGAVAKLSDGYVCDPQLDVTVRGGYLPKYKRADRIR